MAHGRKRKQGNGSAETQRLRVQSWKAGQWRWQESRQTTTRSFGKVLSFAALLAERPCPHPAIVTKDEAPPPRLGCHALTPPPAAWRFFRCGLFGGSFRRHRATEFEGLVEIVGDTRRLVAAVAEIDAILARQTPDGDTERAQLRCYKFKAGARVIGSHGASLRAIVEINMGGIKLKIDFSFCGFGGRWLCPRIGKIKVLCPDFARALY